MQKHSLLTIVSFLGLAAFVPHARATVIFSDNFESDPLDSPYGFASASPSTYTTADTIVHTFPTSVSSKWTISGFSSVTNRSDPVFSQVDASDPDPSNNHGHFVALNGVLTNGPRNSDGATGVDGPGILTTQTIDIPAAGTYQLEFQLDGSHRKAGTGSPDFNETANVQVYDSTNGPGNHTVFTIDPNKNVENITQSWSTLWTTYDFTFTATQAYHNVHIQFEDGGATNDDTVGLLLDNVSLSSVPEPASMSLLGLAAGGLMVRRKRK